MARIILIVTAGASAPQILTPCSQAARAQRRRAAMVSVVIGNRSLVVVIDCRSSVDRAVGWNNSDVV